MFDLAKGTVPLDVPDVSAASLSPDGNKVAGVTKEEQAAIWDVESGQPQVHLKGGLSSVKEATFSPDGRYVVTASSISILGAAEVWDPNTGKKVHSNFMRQNSLWRMSFSPDSRLLVTAGHSDRDVRVWDFKTGTEHIHPLMHANWASTAQFSTDGRWLVTSSLDGTARVWEVTLPPPASVVERVDGRVLDVGFPAGTCTGAYEEDDRVGMWDLQKGECIARTEAVPGGTIQAQFSPDGKLLLTLNGDGGATAWDASTGRKVVDCPEPDGPVAEVVFDPSGKRACMVSRKGKAAVWELASGERKPKLVLKAAGVQRAAFSEDGLSIATVGDKSDEPEAYAVRVWDVGTGAETTPRAIEVKASVRKVALDRHGARVVLACGSHRETPSGEAQVWDVKTAKQLFTLKHESTLYDASFSPDGERIVTASQDNSARIWDAETGKSLTPPLKPGVNVRNAAVAQAVFSRNGRYILTTSDAPPGIPTEVRLWDSATGEPVTLALRHRGTATAWLSPDNHTIVSMSSEDKVRIWDLRPDPRRAEQLVALAELLTGDRLEPSSLGQFPLLPSEIPSVWRTFQQR